MKFKDFVRERDVQRIEEINNFFDQPIEIIVEVIELGKTRVIKSGETIDSVDYLFKIKDDVYGVTFGRMKIMNIKCHLFWKAIKGKLLIYQIDFNQIRFIRVYWI